jgi:3-oxoacyl-[acyl-carrier protein] reductase
MIAPQDLFDLTGKVAVITGAGSGIGQGSAQLLAAAGAQVVCGDIDLGRLEVTLGQIESEGGSAIAVQVDTTSKPAVEALVQRAIDEYGQIDVMGNIAGIIRDASVLDTTEAEFDRVLAVNLKGTLFGCQAAARIMQQQGSGSIVNIASAAIDRASANLVSYGTSKAAVAQLTKILAVEMGPSGVRVNAIAPGIVMTAMTTRHFTAPDGTVNEGARDAVVESMSRNAPLGRMGTPEDVARSVLFLASEASSYMTGQIIRPNGGVAMP